VYEQEGKLKMRAPIGYDRQYTESMMGRIEMNCLKCERTIDGETIGERFCSTHCENDWWSSPTAGLEWEAMSKK
jgi:hypothetical protein